MSEKLLNALKESLQALVQPAMVQDTLFPDALSKGDEMAFQFDQAYEAVDEADVAMTEEQDSALNELDQYIDDLSPDDDNDDSMDDFWCDATQLYKDKRWEEMRRLASEVLISFGWPQEVPPQKFTK